MGKYKTYEKYKPSSVGWLDEIPKHWRIMRLKFGYEACLGKMLTSSPSSPEDTLEPYLRSANVLWGSVDISDIREMYFSPYEKEIYSLKSGDLVVSEGGDVGRAAIWSGEIENCYIQNAVHRIRSKDGFLNKFLYYWLSFLKAAGYIDLLCSKATIAHLTLDKLRELPVYNPPFEEQKSIAHFLDHETTRIDTLITKKRQLIDLLQKKWFSAITYAVTKGLNHKVEMNDADVFWLEEVPEHWRLCQLKFACILQRGFDLPSQERQEGEFPVYGGGGITGYHDQAMIQPPGVVTGRYGTVGEVYYVEEPFWPLNTSLYVKEFWGNSSKFIHYLLSALPIDIYAEQDCRTSNSC